MNVFPNTGTRVDGHSASGSEQTNALNSSLSTQIIIKVNGEPVGALQRLSVAQNRPLQRIQEIGTDGVIEIVPVNATTFELSADRIVFDQLRLPEAFSRGFKFINSQRLPFDIEIIDLTGTVPNTEPASDMTGIASVVYRNCWFTRYDTPYAADNYIITETAQIWCETGYVVEPGPQDIRAIAAETDTAGIEAFTNTGGRRGSFDASGLVKSVFNTAT